MKAIGLVVAICLLAAVDGAVRERIARAADSKLAYQTLTLDNLASLANLGSRNSFRETHNDRFTTAKGVQRCRLTQTYAGLDVHGASAEAELDMNGQLTGQMYGHVFSELESDIADPDACMEDISAMIDVAISTEGFSTDDSNIDTKDGQRLVYVNPDTSTGHLAYRVEFFYAGSDYVSFPAYYIDACNQQVLASFNQVQNSSLPRMRRQEQTDQCETDSTTTTTTTTTTSTTRQTTRNPPTSCAVNAAGVGGNPKTGRTVYNTPPLCLNVRQDGSTCYMENTYARVIDNEQSTTRSKNTVVSFTCTEGYSDPVNEAYGVASDAMYFGDITGRLYVEKYNVRALPYAPRLVVHYDSCYDNAFWNGVDMFFGDGCSYFYPLVNQDVVTHELGHGITTRNSNLEYRRQSGGINEAFSDISGEVAEVFGRASNDWLVGRELFKGNGALRYFINPPDDRRSIKHVRDYRDGMDVHYSSGIFNHAFYQLVAIQEMPIYDAYSCFLEANLMIWRSTTGFDEGACGVKQACFDNGFDTSKVDAAFSVVGIDLASCSVGSLDTVVHLGTTRRDILASESRNPILKVDIGDTPSVSVSAMAGDESDVQISVSTDIETMNVLTSGTNDVTFTNPGADFVYVKLSSASTDDVKVVMTVSGA